MCKWEIRKFLSAIKSNVLKEFKNQIKDIGMNKLVQVSMDGANVKFKFFEDLKKDLEIYFENDFRRFVQMGNKEVFKCDLYIIFFRRSPGRRGDYVEYTGSKEFPKKNTFTRWVDNVEVSEKAGKLIDSLKKCVESFR